MTEELILDEAADKMPPKTVVLQPIELFDKTFQAHLEQAIEQADAIIIDLLWVNQIDQTGITLLLDSLNQARNSGKSLSFLSMDHKTRTQLDATWEQQRAKEMSEPANIFTPAFEQFLDQHRSTNN